MDQFPEFMLDEANAIAQGAQSKGVKGWVYQGADNKQLAYWVCLEDGDASEHAHDFDEYVAVLEGEYCIVMNQRQIMLRRGDELHIPATIPHSGHFRKGTRTLHCFGGKRI